MRFSELVPQSARALTAAVAILATITLNSCKNPTEPEAKDAQTDTVDTSHLFKNNLENAQSTLEASQASAPIHWQPWSKSIFAGAKAERKTILAYIGSGTDPYTIDLLEQLNQSQEACDTLNKHHVNVLIDSNLYPDLEFFTASLCLKSKTAATNPFLIWFSYEGAPISWMALSQNTNHDFANFVTRTSNTVNQTWLDSPEYVLENSRRDFSHRLNQNLPKLDKSDNQSITPTQATRRAAALFDPTSSTIDNSGKLTIARCVKLFTVASFRTDISKRQQTHYLDIAEKTADRMMLHGLIDPLDGGIYAGNPYSSTDLPIFAKELKAQAYSIDALYSLYKASGKMRFLKAANAIVDYTENNLKLPNGGYSIGIIYAGRSSQNNPCTWTLEELEAALTPEEMKTCTLAFGVKAMGNIPMADDRTRAYIHNNTLTWKTTPSELATRIGTDTPSLLKQLGSITKKLAKARQEKSTTSRNETLSTSGASALLVSAYTSAYRATGDSKHLERATKNLSFIRDHFIDDSGNVFHALYQDKRLAIPAMGADYALIAKAALDLHQVAPEPKWLKLATEVHQGMSKRLSNTENYRLLESDGANELTPLKIYQFTTVPQLDNENTWALANANAKRLSKIAPSEQLKAQSSALQATIQKTLSAHPFSSIDFLTEDAKLQHTQR